jgi:hypothetical protein
MPDRPHGLGRRVHHDPRSRAFPARAAAAVHDVAWRHYGPVLDQGQLGSCTGHALVDCLMTRPYYTTGRRLTHDDAVRAYKRATVIDPFPGAYPPTDTGSDGLDVCRAAVEFGWITGYDHAFGIDHLLGSLMLGPVMVGTEWRDAMFNPDARGRLTVAGPVVGGHEYTITAKSGKWLRILNSWGSGWGLGGTAWIRIDDLAALLDAQGDVTVPRR